MSDLASITSLQELIEFLSNFIETVPTQEYVDGELDKKISAAALGELLPKYVTMLEFNQRMSSKADMSDLILSVATKADRNEVLSGIARKANLSGLYKLEAKLNKLFPFKCVENIAERNALYGDDLEKVILVVDATADETLTGESTGALYMYSKLRGAWVLQSEIKYNAEQISYNRILGKPSSSAAEIDTVVGLIVEKMEYIIKLHEIFVKTHTHEKIDSDISLAVNNSHSHSTAPEVSSVVDSDLIPIVRDGVVMNVKASVLKEYLG